MADAARRRVLDAAAMLGFDGPHPAGRLLRTRAAHCVGVVVDRSLATVFRHPYYLRPNVDAVVAMSDTVARELRRRLPTGIAVAGFDGLETGDGLATLVQPVAEKGRLAVHEIYAPSGVRDRVLATRFADGASLDGG